MFSLGVLCTTRLRRGERISAPKTLSAILELDSLEPRSAPAARETQNSQREALTPNKDREA